MKIILTGTSGFIGRNLRDVLSSGEYVVVPFVGDIRRVLDWKKSLENDAEAIIHVAGIRTESENDLKVNLGGVEAL